MSDYGGLQAQDPALVAFMRGLGLNPGRADDPGFDFPRPIREVTASLERLTNHDGGLSPEAWQKWWAAKGQEFIGKSPNGWMHWTAVSLPLHDPG